MTEVVIPINTLCGSLQQHGFQLNLLNVRDLNPTCIKKCQEQQFYFGSTAKKFMEFTIEKTSLTDETVPMPQNYEKYRVWFKILWFIFHDSSWSFHKPYFRRKCIFHKLYCVNRYKIKVLKSGNKYQIIWQCLNFKNILINNFQHHPFPYQVYTNLTCPVV